MKHNDALKHMVETYGWLAVREIFFDNNVQARPLNCDGFITMDADSIYWTYSTSVAEHEQYNKHLLTDAPRMFSYFKHLKMKDLEHVQGVDFVLYHDPESLVNPETADINLPHDFTATQNYVTVVHGDAKISLKAETDPLEDDEEITPTGSRIYYEKSLAIKLPDGTYMTKELLDRFNTNREKFKQYLVSTLGLTYSTLL